MIVTVNRCPSCHGSGECVECEGSGVNTRLSQDEPSCRNCAGSGVCRSCGGTGSSEVSDLQPEILDLGLDE